MSHCRWIPITLTSRYVKLSIDTYCLTNGYVNLSIDICCFEADSYANPIPSFRFWLGRKNNLSFVQNRNRLLVRRWCSSHLFFCWCDSEFSFWTQKIQANAEYYVRRRAECTSLDPGLKHPSLRSLTLVWPRRDVPRRFTWCFFSTKYPSPAGELLRLCVYSRMIRGHERRALGALLFLLSRSEPASTDSQL